MSEQKKGMNCPQCAETVVMRKKFRNYFGLAVVCTLSAGIMLVLSVYALLVGGIDVLGGKSVVLLIVATFFLVGFVVALGLRDFLSPAQLYCFYSDGSKFPVGWHVHKNSFLAEGLALLISLTFGSSRLVRVSGDRETQIGEWRLVNIPEFLKSEAASGAADYPATHVAFSDAYGGQITTHLKRAFELMREECSVRDLLDVRDRRIRCLDGAIPAPEIDQLLSNMREHAREHPSEIGALYRRVLEEMRTVDWVRHVQFPSQEVDSIWGRVKDEHKQQLSQARARSRKTGSAG